MAHGRLAAARTGQPLHNGVHRQVQAQSAPNQQEVEKELQACHIEVHDHKMAKASLHDKKVKQLMEPQAAA